MIINATNSSSSASILQSAQTRSQKTAAKTSAETAASPADTLADQVMIASQNIVSAVSPLPDADATRAALQAVRKQFLAQPEVALRAQANQLPQNALRLLQ